jgi:hypothetical protein
MPTAPIKGGKADRKPCDNGRRDNDRRDNDRHSGTDRQCRAGAGAAPWAQRRQRPAAGGRARLAS